MAALRPLMLLLLLPPLGPGPGSGGEARGSRTCTETRQVLGTRGYSLNLLPPSLISGEHLRVCPQDYTCCSSETELRLNRDTDEAFRALLEDSGSFLVTTLAARQRKLDEFFRELLVTAERSLAQMFSRSYGRLFAQHAPVFGSLFAQLRAHYGGAGVALDEALDGFWAQLLERTFPLLHPHYHFPPDYLLCLTKHSGQTRPFGDAPRQLRLQVTRALVAARAFIQGLATGRDMISAAVKVAITPACSQALMRLTGCPLCRGTPGLRPCAGFCLNVARGCLSAGGLDPDWGSYVDALLQLSDRLEGPFSMELAAQSIAVKISEGLMFLQENSVQVSAKVFQGCGGPRPAPARARRAPPPRDEVGRRFRVLPPEEERPTTAAGTNLHRLLTELRERLRRMRGFWAALPLTLCGDERMSAGVGEEERCWNGAGRGRYLAAVVGTGLSEQRANPELHVDVAAGPDLATRRRRLQLRAATARLGAAALGRDLDLEDADEDGSGSGLGERYVDDWAAAPPARGPRPPRRDTPGGGKGGPGSGRHNQARGAAGRVAVPEGRLLSFLLLLPSGLALLGLR
ncbi:glypican-2 [Tachyglossus aculeatus]|uniref:glypican-2 n=1 Tax=Tachyglossus aculeatus TaxID=9261 RepID=UPI0018F75CF1|nr:glypican-2 [Tachyglossus aculeatus]